MEKEHEFTLILDGIPSFTPEILDALYEAGCDDGLLSRCDGVVSIDFGRIAPSREDAIVSAIRDIEKANVGARVVRVEASELDSTEGIDGEILRLIRGCPTESLNGGYMDAGWARAGDKPEWRNENWSVSLNDESLLLWVVCDSAGNTKDRKQGFTIDQVDQVLEWAERVKQTGKPDPPAFHGQRRALDFM
jgi:hypothetical protein